MKSAIGLLLSILVSFGLSAQRAADFSVTHYTSENGLPQNSIRGIELDRDGFLWIATESGLVRFDGNRFKLFDRDHYPVLQSNRVTALLLDSVKVPCFADEFWNKYTFDRKGRIQQITTPSYLGRIMQFKNNHLWIREDSLLYKVKGKARWAIHISELYYEVNRSWWGRMNNKCYYEDKQGVIWCVDTNRNITRVRIKGLDPHLGDFASDIKLPHGLLEHDTALYFQSGKGIYRLRECGHNELEATLVLETDLKEIQFYRNYPQLNLQVIGTQTKGLYLFRRKQFRTYKHTDGAAIYYPQVPLGDSGVLTHKGVIYPSSVRADYPFPNAVPFRSLLLDSRGRYWANRKLHNNINIVMLDRQLHVKKIFPTAHTANCFRETPDGRIWMCSFQGRQLGYIEKDSVLWLPELWEEPKSVLTFLPVDDQVFWIGGTRILARLNVKTGKKIHYSSLEKYTVETLYLDRNKVLWIGTTGHGFFAINQDRVIKLPLDKNAGLKDVHSFIEDKDGFMWMSTNNGLFRCKKKDLNDYIAGNSADMYYQCFKQESGFNTNEFNGNCTPSAITLGNGKLSFPSIDGLVQFNPDSIREILPVNKIFVDKLLVDEAERCLTGPPVAIAPSFKYLEIQVASPYFGNPANQILEYRLNGLDSIWHPLKEDNTVVFNNLTHGHYNLQFRKRSGFGKDNVIITSIPLFVRPFFYQTLYFKLIILLVAALLIFMIVKIRYHYLVKRNKELELEVSQRTMKLQQANKLKEKMLMMVGHDLQSPLYFLNYLSQVIYNTLQRNDKGKAEEVSLAIKNTSGKIYTFVEEFHLWARVQDETYNLRKDIFALQPLLMELADFSRELLQQNNNILQLEIKENYRLYTNRDLLKAILRNLVDNANKHTQNGIIAIAVTIEKGMGKIAVTDTGKGIAPGELDKIRQLMAGATGQKTPNTSDRLGFQFIIDFTTRLELSLSIESEQDKGTRVSVAGLAFHAAEELMPQSVY